MPASGVRYRDERQDEPDVIWRRGDWQQQADILGKHEMELHFAQLKLIRQQTSTFIDDVGTIKRETAALREAFEATKEEIQTGVNEMKQELRTEVDSLSQALRSEIDALIDSKGIQDVRQKMWSVEASFASVEQELNERAMEEVKLNATCKELSLGLTQNWESLNEMRAKLELRSQENEVLHKDRHVSHEALEDAVQANFGTIEERLNTLERKVGSIAKGQGLESLHQGISGLQNSTLQLTENQNQLELSLGKALKDLEESNRSLDILHGRLAEHHQQLAKHASLEETLEQHESAQKEVKAELERLRTELSRRGTPPRGQVAGDVSSLPPALPTGARAEEQQDMHKQRSQSHDSRQPRENLHVAGAMAEEQKDKQKQQSPTLDGRPPRENSYTPGQAQQRPPPTGVAPGGMDPPRGAGQHWRPPMPGLGQPAMPPLHQPNLPPGPFGCPGMVPVNAPRRGSALSWHGHPHH